MGHTNSTANLSLPQFIGTDKPTWLGDVNGAFSAIDSKVGTIDADIAATDAKADNAVADAASAVATATSANTTAGNASTTATNALNIANNALTIANNSDGHTNQLEMKVGLLADLTTTDKTSIVNAINEVNGKDAGDIAYDNSGSGLTATNVQDAIDEVAQGGGGVGSVSVTGDGTKTYSILLNELFALIDPAKVSGKSYVIWSDPGVNEVICALGLTATNRYDVASVHESNIVKFSIKNTGSTYYVYSMTTSTNTNNSGGPVTSGNTITFYY